MRYLDDFCSEIVVDNVKNVYLCKDKNNGVVNVSTYEEVICNFWWLWRFMLRCFKNYITISN